MAGGIDAFRGSRPRYTRTGVAARCAREMEIRKFEYVCEVTCLVMLISDGPSDGADVCILVIVMPWAILMSIIKGNKAPYRHPV